MRVDTPPRMAADADLQAARDSVAQVIRGKDRVIDLALTVLLAEGHLLLEDAPGVGKTTLALALAATLRLDSRRIQFTSDLLPGDVLGVSVYHQREDAFRFHPGPIFCNILLADEINRATPKTQSALLEAMSEAQVSLDGATRPLKRPFMVIATQNPYEHVGVFPLPESQLDRFMLKISMDYPDRKEELEILRKEGGVPMLERLQPAMDAEAVLRLQKKRGEVRVQPELLDYLMDIVQATRDHGRLAQGVSTRGALALLEAVKALAMVRGRDYALPDDVKELAPAALGHRIGFRDAADPSAGSGLIEEILDAIPAPA